MASLILTVAVWYCSVGCAELAGQRPDYVRNYAISLTWYGLMDQVHRDTIREGDGLAMMSMWRLNMLRFWEGNHYKYLIIGHRLLSGMLWEIALGNQNKFYVVYIIYVPFTFKVTNMAIIIYCSALKDIYLEHLHIASIVKEMQLWFLGPNSQGNILTSNISNFLSDVQCTQIITQ